MSFWDELEQEEEDWFEDEDDDLSLELAMEEYQPEEYESPSYSPVSMSNSFTDDIVAKESGGNYAATNPNSSAVGKYQFLWNTWGNKIKQFTGVNSKEEFLNNPQAQDAFYNEYYVPNEMYPAIERIKKRTATSLTDDKLAKLYHFRGEKGAIDYLTGKASNQPESYNMPTSEYIKQYGGTSYNPDYNPLASAPGQEVLASNPQVDNLVSPEELNENNELFDFGFVEDMYDVYGNFKSFMKRKGQSLAENISLGIDTANDYLSDLETTRNMRELNRIKVRPRYTSNEVINQPKILL